MTSKKCFLVENMDIDCRQAYVEWTLGNTVAEEEGGGLEHDQEVSSRGMGSG